MSKKSKIRYESELLHEFKQLIKEEKGLGFKAPPGGESQQRLDRVQLVFDGRTHRFKVRYSLKPSVSELQNLVATGKSNDPILIVTPQLSPRILDFCRQHQLSAIDLNGRAYLRAEGLLVDRPAYPDRDFRFDLEPRDFFVGKSARIIRTLLTDRDRSWVQSELVNRTKASSGLVSRIVKHLTHEGFVEKTGTREFRLREPLALLDAWAESDNFARRTKTVRYSVFGGSPVDLAHRLNKLAEDNSLTIAFTQWVAGWLRHPYTEPEVVSAYVSQIPADTTLANFGLRPVNDAGKVWLHVPDDEGVFLETQTVKELPLVSDAQIYLDLLKTGLRGPEQAAALHNWEGFCRP